jgi:hypothetical protein
VRLHIVRRTARRNRRACHRIKRRLIRRLLMIPSVLFETRMVEGVQIVLSETEVDEQSVMKKLSSVLQAMARVDPLKSEQFRRGVQQITIWPGDTTAFDRMGGIHLSASYLLGQSPEAVAAALVHELTHLRIANSGVPYHPSLRERIETICVRKEAAFLRRAGGIHATAMAEEVLSGLHNPWWTRDERRARIRANLERGNLPGWLARFFRFR